MTSFVTVEGKAGIVAKVIADSVSSSDSYSPGKRITTFEITYPRLIHSEFMTHRMLSRNAASSRAIPFAKMKEQLTARPVRFGQANPGMQDKGVDYCVEVHGPRKSGEPDAIWSDARNQMLDYAEAFYDAGYAKQCYNRLTEPFQMIKVVVTATEWENFFWLRDDDAADPTIAELARCMKQAREKSVPLELHPGEWHLPYVPSVRCSDEGYTNELVYINQYEDGWDTLSLEDAINVSSARCAAVSFRNTDYGLEKSKQVFDRLVGDERKHGSALEHQATPMKSEVRSFYNAAGQLDHKKSVNVYCEALSWQDGVSHFSKHGYLWSGNFNGWIQHRKLVAGENKPG